MKNKEEKRIFNIEVGKIAPEDVEEYVNKIKEAFKTPIPLDFKLEDYNEDMTPREDYERRRKL